MKIRALLYSMIAAFAVAFSACDDDLNSVGNTILPDSDNIAMKVDTIFNITAETYSFDNRIYARTTKGTFGDYTDPILGRVKSDYLCEFNCPEDGTLHSKLFAIDSVQVRLFFSKYTGDDSAPMGITMFEVDKKELEYNTYTNIDPTEYSSMDKVFAKAAFSIRNTLSVKDAYGNETHKVLSVDADTTKGWDFVNAWKADSTNLQNSDKFKKNVLKGLYITPTYGSGALIDVLRTEFNIYYRYNAGKKVNENADSIGFNIFRLVVTDEVTQMNRVENKIDLPSLNSYTDRTFMKTPAGLCTQLNIPIAEIADKMGDMRNINAATFSLLGFTEEEASLGFNRPSDILLINKDSLDGFFNSKDNILGEERNANTQVLISRSGKDTDIPYNNYNFGNIANIINHYVTLYKDTGSPSQVQMLMVPISTNSFLSAEGNSTTTKAYHMMSPTAAILRTSDKHIKMPLIFSKYNSQSNK